MRAVNLDEVLENWIRTGDAGSVPMGPVLEELRLAREVVRAAKPLIVVHDKSQIGDDMWYSLHDALKVYPEISDD